MQALGAAGRLNGTFVEPIVVHLDFPGADCVHPRASQQLGANSLAVLVELDRSECRRVGTAETQPKKEKQSTGLRLYQEIGIGVACGILGLALLLMCFYCCVRAAMPDLAVGYVMNPSCLPR